MVAITGNNHCTQTTHNNPFFDQWPFFDLAAVVTQGRSGTVHKFTDRVHLSWLSWLFSAVQQVRNASISCYLRLEMECGA